MLFLHQSYRPPLYLAFPRFGVTHWRSIYPCSYSTSTTLLSMCSCLSCGGTGWNEMIISSPSLSISVWYYWSSTSTLNSSAASNSCLTQMFWSVVIIKITETLLTFGVMQQLFITISFGKLWCAVCSTMYDQLLLILEVFPGTVNVAFPGTQIGSLSTPILLCPQAHHEGYNFFLFLIYHISITVDNNGFGIYMLTFFYIIDHSWSDVSIIINTHLWK